MDESEKFEREYGEIAFVKVAISAMNRLLVSKGIVTEYELIDSIEREIKETRQAYEKEMENSREDIKTMLKREMEHRVLIDEIAKKKLDKATKVE